MPSTYTPIATTTLGSAASSVTFSSISGSYTDLVLIIQGGCTAASGNIGMQFNTDVTTNYSSTQLYGTGSAAGSARYSSAGYIQLNYYGYPENNLNMNSIVSIQNYSNTTTYKTSLARNNHANNGANASVGLWRSTAAINQIVLSVTSTTWLAGSTFTLYGVKSA